MNPSNKGESKVSNLAVANCIRDQLGPMAFVMMGASSLVGSDNFLQFNIGVNSRNIYKIRITLESNDLYCVTFYGSDYNTVKNEVSDVYADSLHDTIEHNTGLFLTFGRRN